ncbi:MAG: helix-turn-helix transcriptional regulator [Rhodoferax sp.]|uniref:helix-turn-helix domain-containing protein n=1 Tax=Rhodoferax sp. TaxID=50421 RepID=UPI00260F6642|nr:helix-turn-helix transcriptional regulator [Rhodoferax sp.]MDD5332728.1 helix-turn-helix transcriptional regulator [Rhodoferax sp.]
MGTFALLTHTEICRELGQRCKHLRLQANLSQLELAQRGGASLSSIRRLEASGQATLELLVRVTQALHLVSHLENLLVVPALSIADAERALAAKQRQRAAAPRRAKKQA